MKTFKQFLIEEDEDNDILNALDYIGQNLNPEQPYYAMIKFLMDGGIEYVDERSRTDVKQQPTLPPDLKFLMPGVFARINPDQNPWAPQTNWYAEMYLTNKDLARIMLTHPSRRTHEEVIMADKVWMELYSQLQ